MELSIAAMICLVGITGIWFSFARGFETVVTLEVPVEFMNRGAKMEILATSANSVKLQLSGSGSLIRTVRPDQVKVKLNLANAVVGSNKVAITRDSIVLPPGIQLKQVEPQVFEVNLDVQDQKQLPIQPDWTGKLPAGLILQEAYTIPALVKVVGGQPGSQGHSNHLYGKDSSGKYYHRRQGIRRPRAPAVIFKAGRQVPKSSGGDLQNSQETTSSGNESK